MLLRKDLDMTEKISEEKKVNMTSTKKEILTAYHEALQELEDRRQDEIRPERKIEEKKKKAVVAVADALSSEGVVKGIGDLKIEIGRMLTQVSDRMEEEVGRYRDIRKTIEYKEKEIQELYEIERSALTLAALVESQNKKRREFEVDMAGRKEALTQEIKETRTTWEKEKTEHEAIAKEVYTDEEKRRKREKEEYRYGFQREQQLAKDKFEDEKGALEKEIRLKREEMERELTERERAVAAREAETAELSGRVETYPAEMDAAVSKAIKETTDRLKADMKNREEMLKKEHEGETNVLEARIESLEKTVKEQSDQIAKLSGQLETSYEKVQDIALKAVESSANVKGFQSLQDLVTEQFKKQAQDK